ncbi:MAG: histidine kinase [Bacteroidota bacterium]
MISFFKYHLYLLTGFLLLTSCLDKGFSQTDSLFDVLGTSKSDSIKIQCYLELTEHYIHHKQADSAIIYANKGIEMNKTAELPPEMEFYYQLVRAHNALGEYKTSNQYIVQIIKMLNQSDKAADEAIRMFYSGWLHLSRGEFSQSIETFEKCIIMATELEMDDILSHTYYALARVYYNTTDYGQEEKYYEKFLEAADWDKETRHIPIVLTRLGDIKREDGKIEEGIETYYMLIDYATKINDSVVIANTLNRIAWGYYEYGKLELSLEVYLKDLETSKRIKHKQLVTNCLGNIGNIYRDWNYFEKAIEYYTLSIEVSQEIGDMYNLSWLYKDISAMYANMGRYEMAYNNFMLHSAYNDTLQSENYRRNLLQAQTQYEIEKGERELELMNVRLQRNRYLLYGLGGLSLLIVLIAILWIRTNRLRSRERLEAMNHKVTALTQKNLRSQMNPHFIFNTLNSIQYYVFQNDRMASNDYMTKFAKLIRKTLENSEHPAIPITEELNALELYLELESLRFKKKFSWKIEIDEEIDTYMYKIPTMLIQPFVENAIGHGLMHKPGKGNIQISMKPGEECILCTIEDNGIGREKAMEIKNNKKENYRSLGTSITESRLRLVNSLYGKNMKVEYTDLKDDHGDASGTRVEICIPIIT